MSHAETKTPAKTSDARPRWLWRMVGRLGIVRHADVLRMLANPSALRWHVLRYGPAGYDLTDPSALRWTTSKPTEAGYYWVRAPKLSARVSHFYHAHGQDWLTNNYIHLDFAYGKPVEYAGPLPSPNTESTRGA